MTIIQTQQDAWARIRSHNSQVPDQAKNVRNRSRFKAEEKDCNLTVCKYMISKHCFFFQKWMGIIFFYEVLCLFINISVVELLTFHCEKKI
jgi:hypothetical protein